MASPAPAPAERAPLGVALALGVLYLVWGSSYLATRIAVETIPPYTMLAGRFLVAGGVLYGYLRATGANHPTPAEWWGSARVGTLLLVGGTGSVALAQSLGVSSGVAAVVVSTMPLWFALFTLVWGERVRTVEWLGLGLGLVGVALLNAEADLRANPVAALVVFLAPVGWAFGSVWSRTLPRPPGLMASAAQMLVAGALFVPVALLRGETFVQPPSLASSLALLYLITFGSLLAYSAYLYLLERRVRPALLSSYAYVNPVVAVLLGIFFAGERISGVGFVGVGVILVGVVLAVTAKAAGKAPAAETSSRHR